MSESRESKDVTPNTSTQRHKDLERLLQERADNASIHDCLEAGCKFDPDGKKLKDPKDGQRRPELAEDVKHLARRLKA